MDSVRHLMLLVLVVLASCDSMPVAPPSATGTPTIASSTACRTSEEVTETLRGFFGSFNAGDFAAVERLLSSRFESYSETLEGNHSVTRSRPETIAALRSRHAAGDRIQFTTARVNELDAWDGAAHFGYLELVLLRDGRLIQLGGKGALYCRGDVKGIKVLALGEPG
jgi:hypothetical protein